MNKLTPHYRNDSVNDIDPGLVDYLDKEYFNKLPNLDVKNPKLLVVFSGGNAVGKSTLSRELSKRLKALVIENDAVKKVIHNRCPDLERTDLNKLTWQYTMNLYPRLEELTSNGFVVRDGVIDWYFDRILPIFKGAGYELFVIGYDLSREESLDLVNKRGDFGLTTAKRLAIILDDHIAHIKRFRQTYTPDILLTKDSLFDYEPTIKQLKQSLAKLKSKTDPLSHG